jgi:small subunit ribosomal protein S6
VSTKRIYETIVVLHPELSEEEVETNLQTTVELLKNNGSEIIRTERVGKRRLAYVVQKQRYGYYNLMHFYGTPEALSEMERMFRLSDRVLRYLTVRFDKEDQLTGLTRMGDDDGRDDDRDDRRRGGRRGDGRGDGPHGRMSRDRGMPRRVDDDHDDDDHDDDDDAEERISAASASAADEAAEDDAASVENDAVGKASEESH